MQLGNSIAYAGLFEHEGGMHSLALVSRAANARYTVDFPAQNSYLPACGSIRRVQRNPEPSAHVPGYDGDRFDGQLVQVGVAINNDLVLRLFRPGDVEIVLFGKAAVPTREQISIVLASCGQVYFRTFSVLD